MDAEELLRNEQLEEALTCLQSTVKQFPSEPKHRVFLLQLLCILGRWRRALSELDVLSRLKQADPSGVFLVSMLRSLLQAEQNRADVCRGEATPVLAGKPEDWIGLMVETTRLVAQGRPTEACGLQERVMAAADLPSGSIDGHPFDWIVDADSRFSPLFEAHIGGKYYWIPFSRVRKLGMEPPSSLRDLVWVPAMCTWLNGHQSAIHIPARYPGSEDASEPALRLARRTNWTEEPPGFLLGLGQRYLRTNEAVFPFLKVRELEFRQEVSS